MIPSFNAITEAIASTAPAAPSIWPVIDFVLLIRNIETVRSLYKTFDITDNGVDIRDGHIYLSDRPGLGINLKDEVYNAKDTIHTITKEARHDQMFAVTGDPWAQSPGDDKAGVIQA